MRHLRVIHGIGVLSLTALAGFGGACGGETIPGKHVGQSASTLTRGPRLFLNGSYAGGTVLSRLQARAAANDSAWSGSSGLRQACDSYATGNYELPNGNAYPNKPDVGQGYQGDGYLPVALDLGLCFQVVQGVDSTRQATYGAAGARLLDAMATPAASGGQAPSTDSGYGIRNYGVGMAVGFDWLYPYLSASSPSTIANVTAALDQWISWFDANGFSRAHPVSNYFAGYLLTKTAAAIATDPDDANAATWWSDVQGRLWPSIVEPWWSTSMTGGGWPEGWEYGPRSVLQYSEFFWAVSTGKGLDWASQVPGAAHWPQAQYQEYFAWPSLLHMDDEGTVHSGVTLQPSAATNTGLAMILEYTGDVSHAAMARSWASDVLTTSTTVADDRDDWQKFLYWDPTLSTTSYTSQPLSHVASGPGVVAMRSSWASSASTVWASLTGGPYIDSPESGEQLFNQGSFALTVGDQPVFVNATGWINQVGTSEQFAYDDSWTGSAPRKLYNSFFDSSAHPGQSQQTPDIASTHIERYVDNGTYVRARAAQVEQMYVNPSGGAAPITQFMRDAVFVRPSTFVLYDRTTVASASDDQWVAFHTPTAPVAATPNDSTQRRYDVVVGGATVGSIRTVLPQSAVIAVVTGLGGTAVGRIEVRAPAASAANDWMHVVTPGSSVPDVALIQAGSMNGVLVKGSPRNAVVLFNNDHAGAATTGGITYTVAQTATADHVLADMAGSSTGYAVTATAAGGNVTVTVAQGGGCALSTNGNLSFAVDTAGSVTGCSGASTGTGGGGGGGGGGGDAGADSGSTDAGEGGTNGSCVTASATGTAWQNTAFAAQTGSFVAQWDVTPQGSGTDAAVGVASGVATGWSGVAAIVRFNPSGTVDARNGGAYVAANTLAYTPGSTYHVRMRVDVAKHTYDAYVTPPAGSEVLVAANWGFRTEQVGVTQLDHAVTAADAASVQACNLAVAGTSGGTCVTTDTSDQWLNSAMASQSGTFTSEWDVTPIAAAADGAVGLASGSPSAWSGLAAIVRFNPSNQIDARNGAAYAAVSAVGYTPGTLYHVRMLTNVAAHTYSAWVTTPGGTETAIAGGYAFRTEQQSVTSLNDETATADAQSLQVCGFTVH